MNRSFLEAPILYLLKERPWFAKFLFQMDVIIKEDGPFPAGVTFKNGNYHLIISKNSFLAHTLEQQAAFLEHECYHVIDGHLFRSAPWGETNTAQLINNLAMDTAINQYIHGLPGNCVTLGAYQSLVQKYGYKGPALEEKETFEYYREKFPKKEEERIQQQEDELKKLMSGDHSQWKEVEGNAEERRERARVMGTRAKEGLNAGSVPAGVALALDRLSRSVHPWRRDLKRFPTKCAETSKKFTVKRRNRRFGLVHPGVKKETSMHLAVAVDSSGSMSDKMLHRIFSELSGIERLGVKITVIVCDAEVNDVYDFKRNKIPTVKGRGGTAFAPAFEVAKNLKVDGLIYTTDGCNYDDVEKPNFPVLWALMPNCSVRYDWGWRTWIEVESEN